MEKMEKISNLEMFKGSPIEVFSGSPTQILSGSATEVFSVNQVLQTVEPDHYFLQSWSVSSVSSEAKQFFNICPIQTCIAIESFQKLVIFLQTPLVHRQA